MGSQLKAFAVNMLQQSNVCLSLGSVRTEAVRLDRGVPQGAPELLLLFFLVSEMALASLHESWAKRGSGYLIDGLWLPDVADADDVVLLAMSITALQTMLLEVEEAFAAVGLGLNLGKTNFTSTVACERESPKLPGHAIKWSPRLTFLGTVITPCGNGDEAIRAIFSRVVTDAHEQSAPQPCLHSVGRHRTGHQPKKQYSYINSWFARLGSSVRGLRRCPTDS